MRNVPGKKSCNWENWLDGRWSFTANGSGAEMPDAIANQRVQRGAAGAESIRYVTDNFRDAEELAQTLGFQVVVTERRALRAGTQDWVVKREFVVVPDATGGRENEFSTPRVFR